MSEPTYTRCPGCATVFRVSAAQLALREGQVRCGHCRAVFDANDHRLALDAPRSDEFEMPDELAAGRPTVTLRSADALLPVATEHPAPQAPKPAVTDTPTAEAGAPSPPAPDASRPSDVVAHASTRSDAAPSAAPEASTEAAPAVDDGGLRAARFEWKPRKPLRERPGTMYGVAIALLVFALIVQAVLEYGDALAAHAPSTRPLLAGACELFGCTVGPLRDAGALSIDASDLQADPALRGLLKLTATIRNRAPYAIAWPHLELTLTDASDHAVARRVFAPAEYAGGPGEAARGIAGNGENALTLFLDASQTSQAGYRLYLFYP